ncbi:MAG: hypothetical protein JNL26_04530 [Gemmatimonadetes bacterium]|nr:hypothetical protein [Gemmatimonadota bacterium]
MPRRLFTLALVSAATATPGHAQDTTLTRLLIANRHPISIVDGKLAGTGGRHLVAQSAAARFVMLGEEHGVAEAPTAMGALLDELRPAGFHTLAIEVSPLRGRELDRMARGARSNAALSAALDSLLADWRTTVPFYVLGEERAMLRDAMSRRGTDGPLRIWGLDYEVNADRQYLAELERLVPGPAVRAARERAEAGFARLVNAGDPSQLFAFSAPATTFEAIRKEVGPRAPARAREIVDLLERTASINRLFLAGRGYESNLERSRFLRENFARAWKARTAGVEDKVVFKFGGSHMMRGMNYTNTLDLGTTASVLAEELGGYSYHVLMMGGKGSTSTRMSIVKAQYEPNGAAEVDGRMLAWLRPAIPDTGWVLFDVKAARLAYLQGRTRGELPATHDRFFQAYDAIVVFGGSHPGTVRPLRASMP